jgi:hypothetical protein
MRKSGWVGVGVGTLVAVRDDVDLGPVQNCPSLVQRHLEEEPQDRHGRRIDGWRLNAGRGQMQLERTQILGGRGVGGPAQKG